LEELSSELIEARLSEISAAEGREDLKTEIGAIIQNSGLKVKDLILLNAE
jgi:hypothetical protein